MKKLSMIVMALLSRLVLMSSCRQGGGIKVRWKNIRVQEVN